MCTVCHRLGKKAELKQYEEGSLECARGVGSNAVAETLNLLANLYVQDGDIPTAIKYKKECLSVLKKNFPDSPLIDDVNSELAKTYELLQNRQPQSGKI